MNGGMTFDETCRKHNCAIGSIFKAESRGALTFTIKRVKDMNSHEYGEYFGDRIATVAFRRVMLRKMISEREIVACEECDASTWRGGRLPIELDHIDGNSKHNLRPNLRILCCNCHAQTPTYRGRNIKFQREARVLPLN